MLRCAQNEPSRALRIFIVVLVQQQNKLRLWAMGMRLVAAPLLCEPLRLVGHLRARVGDILTLMLASKAALGELSGSPKEAGGLLRDWYVSTGTAAALIFVCAASLLPWY